MKMAKRSSEEFQEVAKGIVVNIFWTKTKR